ncbi:MAG: type 4a pilus biogenesis protein PilO [Candidatus Gastranaerophilales bacterium]|nr:type 4a pilus biogenesis protein PilO [Candidatus Gastranaerophilales bacterium]
MDESKKLLLISFIPAILSFILIFNLIIPENLELNKLKDSLKIQKTELQNLEARLEVAKKNEKEIKEVNELKEELADFDYRIPYNNETAMLLLDLEKFAQKNKLEVLYFDKKREAQIPIIDPIAAAEKAKEKKSSRRKKEKEIPLAILCEIPLEIRIVGDFPNILEFIGQVEKYQRLMSIDGVLMKDYEKDVFKSASRVEITLNTKIYKFQPQQQPSETDEKTSK